MPGTKVGARGTGRELLAAAAPLLADGAGGASLSAGTGLAISSPRGFLQTPGFFGLENRGRLCLFHQKWWGGNLQRARAENDKDPGASRALQLGTQGQLLAPLT